MSWTAAGLSAMLEVRVMQIKKAGFLTKLVVMVMLIVLAISLLNMRTQLQTYQAERDALAVRVAQVEQENTELAFAIENRDDAEVLESVARDKGFVKAGEKLFVDIAN